MRLLRRRARHSLLCIVPPHLLLHLARQTDPRLRVTAEAALQTLLVSERLRGERDGIGGIAPLAVTPAGRERRTIYDARQHDQLPGTIVRSEGDPAVADVAVDEAYDGLGATYDLYDQVFQRNSIDGRGMRLDACGSMRMRTSAAWSCLGKARRSRGAWTGSTLSLPRTSTAWSRSIPNW